MWKFLAGVAFGVIGTIIYEDAQKVKALGKGDDAEFVEGDCQEELAEGAC